jgi:hypothetical protein
MWNQATIASTSNGESADLWIIGLGTGSTYIVSRASTGMDSGSFCAGISYTHTVVSDLHQVAAMPADLKGQVISFSVKVATATANACRPFISTDGGTTKTYGNFNTGLGATTYEVLKVEGVTVPASATVWYGLELRATSTILVDSAALALGSAAETAYGPMFPKSAAWTTTTGSTVRVVDMTQATITTTLFQAFGSLIRDLQAAGILQ